MILEINFTSKINGEKIISKTIKRDVIKKEDSIYGIYYTLRCGWFVDFNNHFKRWEITTISKGEFIGRFAKDDIKEIK